MTYLQPVPTASLASETSSANAGGEAVGALPSAIVERIDWARGQAQFFMSSRRKDIELYELLSECLGICEQAGADGLFDDLKSECLRRAKDRGIKRPHMQTSADLPLVIGRLVFEGEKGRAAAWRYTATLREALNAGIRSSNFTEWLRANGGINALFKARETSARSVLTKTLHLNAPVVAPKDEEITLVLRRCSNGFFDVVSQS